MLTSSIARRTAPCRPVIVAAGCLSLFVLPLSPLGAQRAIEPAVAVHADSAHAPGAVAPSLGADIARSATRTAVFTTGGSLVALAALCGLELVSCSHAETRRGVRDAFVIGASWGLVSGIVEGSARHARRPAPSPAAEPGRARREP